MGRRATALCWRCPWQRRLWARPSRSVRAAEAKSRAISERARADHNVSGRCAGCGCVDCCRCGMFSHKDDLEELRSSAGPELPPLCQSPSPSAAEKDLLV